MGCLLAFAPALSPRAGGALPSVFPPCCPGLVLGLPDDLPLGVVELFGKAYLAGMEVDTSHMGVWAVVLAWVPMPSASRRASGT